MDLAALNIQRGRAHGLASYNDLRRAFDLDPATSLSDIHPDPGVVSALASVYDDVDTSLHKMAKLSLTAHLIKLRDESRATEHAADESWELL